MSKKSTHCTTRKLLSIRERALKATAKSVMSIRRQYDSEPDEDETVRVALKDSEESMFMLAVKAGDDDEKRTRDILTSFGLDDIK